MNFFSWRWTWWPSYVGCFVRDKSENSRGCCHRRSGRVLLWKIWIWRLRQRRIRNDSSIRRVCAAILYIKIILWLKLLQHLQFPIAVTVPTVHRVTPAKAKFSPKADLHHHILATLATRTPVHTVHTVMIPTTIITTIMISLRFRIMRMALKSTALVTSQIDQFQAKMDHPPRHRIAVSRHLQRLQCHQCHRCLRRHQLCPNHQRHAISDRLTWEFWKSKNKKFYSFLVVNR